MTIIMPHDSSFKVASVIIKRYITKEVLNTLIAATLVLLLALLCQQSVRYLNYVASGKIPTNILLTLISFEIPYLVALLLPLGLYLAILLTYGRLYADNEMSVLQLGGFNKTKLLRLTMCFAGFIAIIVFVLMLWINPIISAKRQQLMSSEQITLHLIQTLIPGRFQVSPDGKNVMFVEKLSRNHAKAKNIFLAQKKPPVATDQQTISPWMLVLAKEGYQANLPHTQDQFFVTADGFRYEGVPGQNDYKITAFKKYEVRIPKTEVRVSHEANEAMTTQELVADYANPKHAAELQWRISVGILALLLALFALPLSILRPRQSRYLRLLPAILIYIVYVNMLLIARHWVEQGTLPISLGLWWVHGAFLILLAVTFVLRLR